MYWFILIAAVICLIGINFKSINGIDKNALDKERTNAINGIFVIIIIFNHFSQYITLTNKIDIVLLNIITQKIEQLMVTTFLFFSGYGIFEQIKKRKDYIKNFFKNRFIKVYIPFALAIIIYIIMNSLLKINYSLDKILLSFIGLESIGNSNWFMFCTFSLYICTIISFYIFQKDKLNAIILNTIFTFIYIYLNIKMQKYSLWFNTSLCFVAGMYFSYFKNSFFKVLKNRNTYIVLLLLLLVAFKIIYPQKSNWVAFEILSIIFVLIIILLNLKIKIGNPILDWLGKNTFNIYILQRVSYISLGHFQIISSRIHLYFILSLIMTFILVIIFDKITKLIFKILNI